MCLITLNKKQTVAKHDIVVYKVMFDDGTHLRTPYTGALYKLGETVKLKFRDEPIEVNTTWSSWIHKQYAHGRRVFSVDVGFHTFGKLSDAVEICEHLKTYDFDSNKYRFPKVYRCVIPAGANYYVGMCNIGFGLGLQKSYCSDSLKVERAKH